MMGDLVVLQTAADAEKAYRDAVRAACDTTPRRTDCDAEILRAAQRLPGDFARDVDTLHKRRAAVKDLAEADRLDRLAGEVKVKSVEELLMSPVAQFATLGDVMEAIDVCTGKAVSGTNLRRHELQANATSARTAARDILRRTADPDLSARMAHLQSQVDTITRRRADREQLVNWPAQVEQLRTAVEQLDRGEWPSNTEAMVANGQGHNMTAWYKLRRAELKALLGKEAAHREALKADKADELAIAAIRADIKAIDAGKLTPEKMAWSD
jgi:hypothetical protein